MTLIHNILMPKKYLVFATTVHRTFPSVLKYYQLKGEICGTSSCDLMTLLRINLGYKIYKAIIEHNNGDEDYPKAGQECMVQLGNLQLFVCSESIQSVSLSSLCRIGKEPKTIDSLINKFGASNDNLQQSFHQFTKLKLNAGKYTNKLVVP
jgi:hypothetical protein